MRPKSLVILVAMFAGVSLAPAQQPRSLTAADYAHAEKFLAPALTSLVVGGSAFPNWLPDECFWYRNTTAAGIEFILVDPAKRTRAPAFDHAKLAAALSAAAGATYNAQQLPFQSIDISSDGKTVSFDIATRRWSCDVMGANCAAAGDAIGARGAGGRGGGGRGSGGGGGRGGGAGNAVTSPDGKRATYIRDWNLWLRDVETNQEKQLTSDGVKYFGYATDNAGWSSSDRAIVLWAPDSKKIATYQQDEREVGEMYLVSTPVNPVTHPALRVSKFPLPGDPVMAMLHRVIIEADTGRVVRLQMEPDYHRATLGDNFSLRDMQWSPDGSKLAFISTSRDHKQAVLRVADAATGAVRTVFEEKVQTQYESRIQCQVLWTTNEFLWYSERDNWGQIYLYDLNTGKLKNQITTGEGPVMQLVRLDEKNRTLWFEAQGREKEQDPYFRHYYRVGMDGKNYVSLTPDDGDHTIQLSPSGRYLVDTYSKPDVAPAVTLRDGDGKLILQLEKADISKLLATGWKPPIPIKMTAHDGKTDIYGLMFQPTNLDPKKKYPIINNIYPGPQTGSTGSRSFSAARGDRQALAELGFVVVTIDGMGTPGRSKAFQDAYYGAMGRDNTIPDQIAGMKELAQRYPFIDIDRAGIWGHSGGGFATTTAMFRFPDFFKAGIAESGNHDQRINEDDWGERYQGLVVRNADGTDNYDAEANENFAKNLKGHLLLAHGTMDTNVPPYQTLMIVDALIKANKDFDLIMLPNQNHGYGTASSYMMRRRWDYFVKWLLGAEPPKEYQMQQPTGGRGGAPPGQMPRQHPGPAPMSANGSLPHLDLDLDLDVDLDHSARR
ncbi:MAG: DPP IV N-terminal domain-containing protein [Acidobacteriota bacterium]